MESSTKSVLEGIEGLLGKISGDSITMISWLSESDETLLLRGSGEAAAITLTAFGIGDNSTELSVTLAP